MLVKKEYTNHRDLAYSNWHRTLSSKCYAMDIDWVEWRNGRGIVALIEEKKNSNMTWFEWTVMKDISQKLNVPAYYVRSTDLTKFIVKNLLTNSSVIMTEPEYKNFIESL